MLDEKRIGAIADLLMGAAHADQELSTRESKKVRELLCALVRKPELGAELDRRIDDFSPSEFDLTHAAAIFADDATDVKRHLLALVGSLCHADGVLAFDEDTYVYEVAAALSMKDSDCADLVAATSTAALQAHLDAFDAS